MPVKGKKKPDGTWDTPTGKHPGGAPRFYETPEQLQTAIDDYFRVCDEGQDVERYDTRAQTVVKYHRQTPYTIAGMCYHLGFHTNEAVSEYAHKPQFSQTIARARQKVEAQRTEKATLGEQEPRFAQFDLSCNFGWKEIKVVENTGKDGKPIEIKTDMTMDEATRLYLEMLKG